MQQQQHLLLQALLWVTLALQRRLQSAHRPAPLPTRQQQPLPRKLPAARCWLLRLLGSSTLHVPQRLPCGQALLAAV
jgi:hypothetical protein